MARGFLSGVVWGGVLGLGVSGVVSVLAPLPMPPQVSDAAPGAAQAPARIEQAGSGEAGSESDRRLITGQVAPQSPLPDSDTLAGLDTAALTPAGQPLTGAAGGLDAPASTTETTGVTLDGDDPVLANPLALAPMAPQPVDPLALNTEPAQPPAPSTDLVTGNFDAPAQPAAVDPGVTTNTAVRGSALEATVVSQAPQAPSMPDVTTDSTVIVPPTEEEEIAALTQELQVKPLDPPVTVTTQQVTARTPTEETPTQETATVAAPAEDQTSVEDDSGAVARRTVGTPSITLTDRNSGVTVNRPTGEAAAAEAVTIVSELPEGSDLPPIKRYAQPYERPAEKPLMSIVLIDDGTSAVAGAAGIAALRNFPYPLSFAVDTSLKDAAERMALYRSEGLEVMAMIDLPEGALPSDAETTLGAILPVMSQVVGVLEGTLGGLQGSREVADQVTAILAQSGHGLLTQDKGLNTMPKLARKAGVPADPIFRDFDGKGQTPQVIRRFLDQAAFKAGQEGAVVMLGRLRPDTVSALLLWGLQDRAGKVALAPISAVLLREE